MLSCHTMSISVELPVFKSFPSLSPPHYSSKPVFYNSFFCFGKQNLKCKWRAYVGVTMSKDKSCPQIVCENDSEKFVEVIGIGSKKDSLLDLCLESPFNSSSLRFWNIFMNDSANVQLHQRFLGKDLTPRLVEVSSFLQTCSKAIILLASAGYGEDDTAAINILKKMKAVDGFAIAIILKPFGFEGQRRLDEVKVLEEKLQDHINFCINIDTDRLLEKDLVTLDEALRTANNAVLLAVNAILVLLSDTHRKLSVLRNDVKELKVSEILHILGSYREAKIGFGAGSNIKTSVLQAIYDCPFIGAGIKEVSGMVICIVASSNTFDNDDLRGFLHTFRQTTEYMGEIIVSSVGEPNLESNLLVTTVITLGSLEQKASQKTSILSRLAHHFPFVFNLLKRHDQQLSDTQGKNAIEDACLSEVTGSPDSGEMENNITVEAGAKGVYNYSGEVQKVSSNYDKIYASSRFKIWDSGIHNSQSGRSEAELYEPRTEPSNFDDQISEGTHSFQREPLNSWNLGPGYQIAQQWAKERAADSRARTTIDNLSIFYLPVGVRAPEELKDGISSSHSQQQDSKTEDDAKALPLSSLSALTGASFEAVRDFYSNASTLLKGKTADACKKQGLLSTRAASMLEAERDSPKKWTPLVEMQYRGGVYKGRCQGGLPEGKGRLILGDGSIYDGMWRYGKRSGLGIFYFSNGDVFQGSWRDDVMHGKGWFYFHTGDRWFANFWKGKANGEGRFYSKSGDIFFGRFRDGWRHGHFLCIDVHGERYTEIWDEGVLVSRKQFDSDIASE